MGKRKLISMSLYAKVYVKVGETEKNAITGNVDTIKSTRHVGTVSLMLFSSFLAQHTLKVISRSSVCLCVEKPQK